MRVFITHECFKFEDITESLLYEGFQIYFHLNELNNDNYSIDIYVRDSNLISSVKSIKDNVITLKHCFRFNEMEYEKLSKFVENIGEEWISFMMNINEKTN